MARDPIPYFKDSLFSRSVEGSLYRNQIFFFFFGGEGVDSPEVKNNWNYVME